MTAINGMGDASANAAALSNQAVEKAGRSAVSGREYTREEIDRTVSELEIPFDPSVILWRVTNTAKIGGQLRGQVIPYADPRAYTDRLNALFTPAGWTRKYAVHTSPNFQRKEDQRTVAKVFVTCDVTIFGLGLHSATGEEWADDPNAGTSAEAQAFKRACSCFGLGRYLYYFSGLWVDLDERKRPASRPQLVGWATPEGWRQGLRPQRAGNCTSSDTGDDQNVTRDQTCQNGTTQPDHHNEIIRQIEGMARPLGRSLYRGLLKTLARAWQPGDVRDPVLLQKILRHMQSAARGLRRLEAALEESPDALAKVLHAVNVMSLERVDDLETLYKIVVAVEEESESAR